LTALSVDFHLSAGISSHPKKPLKLVYGSAHKVGAKTERIARALVQEAPAFGGWDCSAEWVTSAVRDGIVALLL
jgi:hypothetical protein